MAGALRCCAIERYAVALQQWVRLAKLSAPKKREDAYMAKKVPDVLPLSPYFREMVWGGRRLHSLFDKPLPAGKSIGESFELSAYPERESAVAAGPLAGVGLIELVRDYADELLGAAVVERYGARLPLLIKLLDAREDLSVQVHPDDAYARAKGLRDDGKMEAWLILHSDGGRVAYGLVEGVGREDFAVAIAAGRVEEVIRFFPVQRGDLVFSPPGTVHALCTGVVIYEVQQSSDLTFRIYDYDRLGLDGQKRELHIEQALEVVDFAAKLPVPQSWSSLPGADESGVELVDCEHFKFSYHCSDVAEHESGASFAALTLVGGQALLRGDGVEHTLRAGETALVPAGRRLTVERRGDEQLEYVISSAATS
jgi:mannose-6-phosphate isomerase